MMARAAAFVDNGIYEPEDVTGDGGVGGFTATYDPKGGQGRLLVELSVNAKFQDSLIVGADGQVMPMYPKQHDVFHGGIAALLFQAAEKINRLPAAERVAALVPFQWRPHKIGPWTVLLRQLIESRWGHQFSFFLNRPQHEWIGAGVDVHLDVRDVRELPAVDDDEAHLDLVVWKMPEAMEEASREYVDSGTPGTARDEEMTLDSRSILPRHSWAILPRRRNSAQIPAVHEFGHAFGLGDEYPEGERSVGDKPSHAASAAEMTDARGEKFPDAVVEDNKNVMSGGNVMLPQHYASFYKALVQLTNEVEWSIGAPAPRARPVGEPDDPEEQIG